jgi:hypothetical protein
MCKKNQKTKITWKKNNWKKKSWKKLIKPIKILKKLTNSVWFRFYKLKTEKIEPNPNRKKTRKQTEPNRKNQANPSQNRKKPSQTFIVFLEIEFNYLLLMNSIIVFGFKSIK